MNIAEDLNGLTCVKCPNNAEYTGVDPKKAWYCRECFVQMVRSKFRSALSKRKIFKDEDSRDVLIVLEGTPSSTFLLHQIDDALRQVNFKRLMIRPTIVLLLNSKSKQETDEFRSRIESFKSILPEKINWIVAHRACSINSDDFGFNEIDTYNEMLSSVKNSTYRLELDRILKEKCLTNLAKSTNISKVMLADDADDLGRLTLSQLCLGRGGALSNLVSVVDKRDSVTFIRPLRDVSKKEIRVVNTLQSYKSIDFPDTPTIPNSIQKLTDEFVHTLENEKFYSTINTVLSTAGKIHNVIVKSCKLCEIENSSHSLCDTCQQIKTECPKLDQMIL